MIQATYIKEPDLIFGHRCEEKDPKLGLMHFGPYFPSDSEKSYQTHIESELSETPLQLH